MPTTTWKVDPDNVARYGERFRMSPVRDAYFKLEENMNLFEELKQQMKESVGVNVTEELKELLELYTDQEKRAIDEEATALIFMTHRMEKYLGLKKHREGVSKKLQDLKSKMKITDKCEKCQEDDEEEDE